VSWPTDLGSSALLYISHETSLIVGYSVKVIVGLYGSNVIRITCEEFLVGPNLLPSLPGTSRALHRHGCTLLFRSVLVCEGDSYSLVESFVIHLSLVGLAGHYYYRKYTLLVFSLEISSELNNRR
jgi:hypothetical protein